VDLIGDDMRTPEELITDAKVAITDGDYDTVVEILCEALGHLSDFSWKTGETWERDDVRDCCHEIGEMIYDDGEIEQMKDVHREVYYEMKPIAARYLEHFWNGCGDGEWRS